jgi:putative secretion ATPase (PEP-CTERM system associated)
MYESYYGLNSKPFQLTPDPAFYYASKWHKRAMSYLQYGLSQAEGFIVITGGIGTGKTTIANSLLNDIQADIEAAQIVTPKLTPDELVKMVAAKFHLDVEAKSKADILKRLEVYLYELHQQGKRALLLVDEAQNLPLETIEELRMLSNFQENGKPLLQSFLLGQEELQPILRAPNMEQFRQRIVASCHLASLSIEEVTSYIEHRLHHAGWTGKRLFSEGAYEQIFSFTRGIPRKINTLMDRILLYGFLEELELLDERAVATVIEEVKSEMFEPHSVQSADSEPEKNADSSQTNDADESVEYTANGNEIKDVKYYKAMLGELVDALDDAISHKVRLTQYIDKLLKKKYRTYVRLKDEK